MSWKRGLTRLYVVLWGAWAAGTGFLAASETYQTVRVVRLAREYVPDSTSAPKTFIPDELPAWPDTGWFARNAPTRAYVGPDGARFWFSPGDSGVLAAVRNHYRDKDEQAKHKDEVAAAVMDGRRSHASRHVVGVLGLWVLGGIILPGALLFVARWVWAGFKHRPEAKT
jgi:hypothetical protein